MLVNLSNHKSNLWNEAQLKAAKEYGEVIDFPFPNVSPTLNSDDINELAVTLSNKVINMKPDAVMCQGEFTLVYHLVRILKENDIKVFAACTERKVSEKINADGTITKTAEFNFVQFREY